MQHEGGKTVSTIRDLKWIGVIAEIYCVECLLAEINLLLCMGEVAGSCLWPSKNTNWLIQRGTEKKNLFVNKSV